MLEKAVTRTWIPAFTAIMLLGVCTQAHAQPLCPEMIRLRGEAQAALKQSRIVPSDERCYRYNRLSDAWRDLARYASDNRDQCHVSIASLNEYEQYHDAALKDRDVVCAGRLLRPYKADIVQH